MSGVNSAAATAAAAAATSVEAAVAMELAALAADAKTLQATLMPGDIVQATVQPFNGITDTLQIFGLRVAASLPPNVYPGDTLTVAVQGFQNDQVLVQVMSRTPSANAPAPPPPASTAAVPQEADSVELTRLPIPITVGEEPEFPPLPPPPVAPPASGTTESESTATPPASASAAAAAAAAADDEVAAQNTVVQTPGATTQQLDYAQSRPETLSVEARLAFARTTPVPPRAPAASTSVPPPRPAATTSASSAQAGRSAAPAGAARPSSLAPPIAPRTPFAPIITPRPDAAVKAPQLIPGAPIQARPTTMMPASQTRPQAPPTAEELLQDPVALLRSLRIPQTPTTLTFAKLVTQQPEQVATALAALESALPDSDDPRILTLRTLAGFVGNLDPESPTFATQIASYLSHVIEGPEQKLAMLVAQDAEPQAAAAAAAPEESADAAPQPQATTPAPVTPAPAAPEDMTIVAAHSAERLAAVDADLKTQLISLLASTQPENTLGETGVVLARNALTGIVASQLSAQQSQAGTWSFTVPIMLGQQMYPARIAVSRDKPEGGPEKLSGDDFHIAFILETKRLGTIAIDMHAVQRSVSVSVRTERPSAATTFKSALAHLGKRLEDMRYNVKALEAGTTRVKTPESQEPPPSDSLSSTDKKA